MTATHLDPLSLLAPGALLGGPLFRSLAASTRAPRLPAGTRLGPFRIEAEIGAGGMGVVYRARRDDGEFDQTVAIKCVARAGAARESALFARERQVLASLRHPNIARLLDGGRHEDGQLWFAMELVEGAAIDAHVRAARLDAPARLRLLRQVVDAVAFAHARLLLHRDLKPANVLIDADGSVKLLDFGIAALAGDDSAARAYSPGWASPEQLSGGVVGPASDQYQLGLLLDALLRDGDDTTGLAATAHASLPATVEPLATAAPIDPARWLPMPLARRRELQAIVARATATEADRRYGSVAEFDVDLGRWLDHRPVAAFGSGVAYTLRCAVRRHPLIAAASLATSVGIAALVVGFSVRLAQERDLARAEAARATLAAQQAEAVSRFLQDDLLALADPNTSQDAELKVRTLLDRAVANVDARLADQPLIAAQIHTTLARSLRGLGAFDAAQAEFARAQALVEPALPADDPRRLEIDLWQGELEVAASDAAAAQVRLQRVAETAARTQGADSKLALEAAVRLQAARFETGEQQAAAEALAALQPRIDAALGIDSPLAINALNQQAIMFNAIERLDESMRVRDEHLARANRVYGPLHSSTVTGQLNRAVLLRKLRRLDEAIAQAEVAEKGLRKVFGDPSIAVLSAMNVRARILLDLGRIDAAVALQRETLAGRIALLGAGHIDVAFSHVNLGGTLVQARRYDEAVVEFERALAIRTRVLGPEHVDVITNLSLLTDTERLRGRLDAAARYGEQATGLARRVLAPDRPERGNSLYRYAQVLAAQGDRAGARTTAEEALATFTRIYPPEHPRIADVRKLLASVAD
jgi:hypothetical protein